MENESEEDALPDSNGFTTIVETAASSSAYVVRFRNISGLVRNNLMSRSVLEARRIAVDGVDSGAAEWAVVLDAGNRIVFRYPGDEYP